MANLHFSIIVHLVIIMINNKPAHRANGEYPMTSVVDISGKIVEPELGLSRGRLEVMKSALAVYW